MTVPSSSADGTWQDEQSRDNSKAGLTPCLFCCNLKECVNLKPTSPPIVPDTTRRTGVIPVMVEEHIHLPSGSVRTVRSFGGLHRITLHGVAGSSAVDYGSPLLGS